MTGVVGLAPCVKIAAPWMTCINSNGRCGGAIIAIIYFAWQVGMIVDTSIPIEICQRLVYYLLFNFVYIGYWIGLQASLGLCSKYVIK